MRIQIINPNTTTSFTELSLNAGRAVASPDEARALIEEGVEVSPLPVLPDDRN